MFDSAILDVAVGLTLLFAILSTLTSAVVETISRFLGLRGAFLLTGLRDLVDGSPAPPPGSAQQKPAARTPRMPKSPSPQAEGAQLTTLLETGVLKNFGTLREGHTADPLGKRKGLSLAQKRALPSYVSSRTFAAGVLDLVVPNADGKTTMDDITTEVAKLPPGVLREQLLNLAKASKGEIDEFRKSIEVWYDDYMDRVSGWYKRYTRWITIAVGTLIVIALNIQLFAFAQSLYSDQTLSKAVVSKAVSGPACKGDDPSRCISQARKQVQSLSPGVALGWAVVPDCVKLSTSKVAVSAVSPDCPTFWQRHGFAAPDNSRDAHSFPLAVTLIIGWLLTILALIPGSRFWFDLINQFSSLRSAGPKPASSTKSSR